MSITAFTNFMSNLDHINHYSRFYINHRFNGEGVPFSFSFPIDGEYVPTFAMNVIDEDSGPMTIEELNNDTFEVDASAIEEWEMNVGWRVSDITTEQTDEAVSASDVQTVELVPENKVIVCQPIFETEYRGDCPICFDPMTMIDFCITRCGHAYHTSCLLESIMSSAEGGCAMCRRQLLPDNAFDEEEEEEEEVEEDDEQEDQDDNVSVWTDIDEDEPEESEVIEE
jgi:hypothetical protein